MNMGLCRSGWATLLLFLGAGCASSAPPPGPGEVRGSVPDLRGHRVMVLPVQLLEGVPGEALADAELAYALGARGEGILWTFPPELEEALRRSPGLPARMRGLPVGMFLQAEVRRIGDPLYGDLRRLAALSGADVALLPIELRYDPEGAYRITAAILDVASGRVGWLGVLRGEPGSPGDPRALASVAEALALALLPLG